MTIKRKPSTVAVRAGLDSDKQFGAVIPPIYLTTNFTFEQLGKARKYDYSRSGNPTRDVLGFALSDMEGGQGAVITSTGMSAVTLVLCTLVRPGDALIVPIDCYGGSWRLFQALASSLQLTVKAVDYNDEDALTDALALSPRLVWIETPSNPLLRITDISRVSALAHSYGALVVVDNTFMSPMLQTPIELGADVVVHSTTKFINGHSDVCAGAVISKSRELADEFGWWANALGLTGAPFDAYLTMRGLRTLPARMRVHSENCEDIVDLCQKQTSVSKIHYPGLSSHPGHQIARKQQHGFGSMLSFELNGGEEAVRHFVYGLEFFSLAESLGGVESLIAHPSTMTHAALTPEERNAAGIGDGLVRLSVGLEHSSDLCADLQRAFDRVEALG